MIKMKLFKMGVIITDKASALSGMLTHIQIGSNKTPFYMFQPRGINPETGLPVASQWIEEERIESVIKEQYEVPYEVIGTMVTDNASGLQGIVTQITIHISGCIHCVIQPKGIIRKTGDMISAFDIDIYRLEGDKIPVMNKVEKKEAKKKNPSPAPMSSITPRR